MITSLITNVHVYGQCREYVGVHELYIRGDEHGSDSHYPVFHYQNGGVYGVSRYDYAYARVPLFRVYVNVHGFP